MALSRRTLQFFCTTFLLIGGCGGGGGRSIPSDAEIVAMCDEIIARVEASSSPTQLAGLRALADLAATYPYPAPTPSGGWLPREITPYQVDPQNPSEFYKMAGIMAMADGHRSAALWATAKALRESPADSELLSQAGVILIDERSCLDADKVLRKAKAEDDRNELVRLNLASSHICAQDVSSAVAELQEAAVIAPDNLVIQEALMNLYKQQVPAIRTHRSAYVSACLEDVYQALEVETSEQLSAFTLQKQNEANALTMQMLNHVAGMPSDIPPQLPQALSDSNDAFLQRYNASCAASLQETVDRVQQLISSKDTEFAEQLSDCCQHTGKPCCSCIQSYCDSLGQMHHDDVVPPCYDELSKFFTCAFSNLRSGEKQMLAAIMGRGKGLSASGADWALRYAYLLLSGHCKEISLEMGYVVELPLLVKDRVFGCTDSAEDVCIDAQMEAYQEQILQRLEAEREAAAQEAELAAEAAVNTNDRRIRGEICLDSLGCLGVDGGKISVKVGGSVFAQFSVDIDNLSVGARLGVGISDPTGGNIAGADISFGGEVSVSGNSTFDISYSQSFAAGTVKQEVALFKMKY